LKRLSRPPEPYCRSFEENHGIEAVSLRYFNVYGPRQRSGQYSGVISIFSRRIHQKLPLRIFGDGSQSRDFVFVSDAVAGTVAALEKGRIQSRVFNIASGREITILQLARTMQGVAKGAPSNLRFEPARRGEVHRSLADITRTQTELGYSPTVPLRDGLSKTMKWFAGDRT
jgi:UDP-glucose 4-epimerase